ncbi:MAG: septum formation initiator family protein [Spongiibacter sp.]|uniref:Cell division protein FtsB n=1 Tax=Spongiibacter thalassae TaxID=2721624 RepID=A0ABX1GFG1_9GAMM|nr:septum formation initiator family protein [Spongiibacter thalassae]MDX1505576.1 septum formation initiator family protein [Spongiibacter sp.]NKI16944.1 cell division protein FtsB [Spongiibacter thalassae]
MTRRRLLILLLLILSALQYRLWTGNGSWEQIVSLRREIAEQQQLNNNQRNRNERLVGEVRSLKHDLDSIGERARSDMGMIGEGETFYLIIEE